jgi:hypothetical protein
MRDMLDVVSIRVVSRVFGIITYAIGIVYVDTLTFASTVQYCGEYAESVYMHTQTRSLCAICGLEKTLWHNPNHLSTGYCQLGALLTQHVN